VAVVLDDDDAADLDGITASHGLLVDDRRVRQRLFEELDAAFEEALTLPRCLQGGNDILILVELGVPRLADLRCRFLASGGAQVLQFALHVIVRRAGERDRLVPHRHRRAPPRRSVQPTPHPHPRPSPAEWSQAAG
jgi:hypothetical protein